MSLTNFTICFSPKINNSKKFHNIGKIIGFDDYLSEFALF